ncbi:hypothetical protein [Roseomonas genomospecies 6]|uniref:Uncharacterized protein n=1 Tax=Roseomonas genomospecies 6 TaxID=214106 RepID=A0A9W7NG38_9PROT|nr:hypothetical protein [Roseomonas genomospecies 6]KAA0677677.1 hypothetical protein DS843_22830 [Roseomonas genomospecies 6]
MPIDYEQHLLDRAREIVTAAGGDASRIEVLHRLKPWAGTSDSLLWLVVDAQGRRFVVVPDAAAGPEVVTPDWCRLQAHRLEASAEELRCVAAAAEEEGRQAPRKPETWSNCIIVSGIKVGVATLEEQCARGHRSAAGWEPPDEDPLIWTDDPQRLILDAEQGPDLLRRLLKSARRHGREVAYDWGELGDASRMIVIVNGAYRPTSLLLRTLGRQSIDENFPAILDEKPDDVMFFDDDQPTDNPTTHWRLASCEVCGDQLLPGKRVCSCGFCLLHPSQASVIGLWQGAVVYAGLGPGPVEWRHDAPPQEIGASILIRMPQIDGFRVRPEGPAVRQPEHAVVATLDSNGWRIGEGSYTGEPEHGWALCKGGPEHD